MRSDLTKVGHSMTPARLAHLRRIATIGGHAKKPHKRPRMTYGTCPVCGGVKRERRILTCGAACGYALRKSKTQPPAPNKICMQCGKSFHSYQKRLFCSYSCHLANGGAFRAGLAAKAAIMKYGAKKDQNHSAIIGALRDCGIAVYDLSNHGHGLPDCAAWVKDQWRLVEIKNPKTGYGKRGLNKVQRKWLGQWRGGPVFIIKTVEEALEFAAGRFESVQVVTSDMCVGER